MSNIKTQLEGRKDSERNIIFYIQGKDEPIKGMIKDMDDDGVLLKDGKYILFKYITMIDFKISNS